MERRLAAAVITALLAGCNDKPAPPASTSAPRPSASAPASAAAVTSAAPTTGEAAAFHVIAQGEAITIYPLGVAAIVDTGAFYAVLGDGPLVQDPALFRASVESAGGKPQITAGLGFGAFVGAWPDQAFAASEAGLVRRVNDLWVRESPLRDGEQILSIAAWEQKRAVAAIRMSEPDIRFQLVGSAAGGVVPAPGKPTDAQEGCAVRMDPAAPYRLAGLPSGHLFAVGRECKTGKPAVERWQPGQVRGEVSTFDFSGKPAAIVAVSAGEAYAIFTEGSTSAHLATWDGKAWAHADAPFGTVSSAFASPDGTVWAVGSEGFYKHPAKGAWTKITARGVRVTSAWAKDQDTVWVVSDGRVLLRSGAEGSAQPFLLPSVAEARAIVDRDHRWPATAACNKVHVMLAAIGPVSGKPPASFPALTAAVRGDAELAALPFVAEDIGGTIYAGAKVPSLAIGEKLAAAYKAKHPKSNPILYCHEATALGPLRIE